MKLCALGHQDLSDAVRFGKQRILTEWRSKWCVRNLNEDARFGIEGITREGRNIHCISLRCNETFSFVV